MRDLYRGVTGKVQTTDFYEYVESELEREADETMIKESTLNGYWKQHDILKGYQKNFPYMK